VLRQSTYSIARPRTVSPPARNEVDRLLTSIQPIANAIGLSALASSYGLGWLSRMSPWP